MAGRVLTLLQEGIAPAQHSGDDFHNSCGIRDEGSDWAGGRERGGKRALNQHLSLVLFAALPVPCRLGCTSEFLIYGHVQQRRAVVETLRLAENEYQDGQDKIHKFEKTTGDCNAQTFKEKSKRVMDIDFSVRMDMSNVLCRQKLLGELLKILKNWVIK